MIYRNCMLNLQIIIYTIKFILSNEFCNWNTFVKSKNCHHTQIKMHGPCTDEYQQSELAPSLSLNASATDIQIAT